MNLKTLALCAVFVPSVALAGAADKATVTRIALANGVPPVLAHAIVRVESRYQCGVRGSHGELGPMQVKPATARSVGVTGNLRDCETGLTAGMRYLRVILVRTGGNWCTAASLYQAGIAARPRCSAYGRQVLALTTNS